MPCYCVVLEGHNFPGGVFGEPDKRYGFLTTRWVMAFHAQHAEKRAVAAVWKDESILASGVKPADGAWLTVDTIERFGHLPRMRGRGASWYEEEPE